MGDKFQARKFLDLFQEVYRYKNNLGIPKNLRLPASYKIVSFDDPQKIVSFDDPDSIALCIWCGEKIGENEALINEYEDEYWCFIKAKDVLCGTSVAEWWKNLREIQEAYATNASREGSARNLTRPGS